MSNVPNRQLYRLTYPEKNAVWYSPTPPPNFREQVAETCREQHYTPTTCNQCSSTFQPWDRPSPNECLEKCTGIPIAKIDACQYENMQYRTKINDTGCLREPSIMSYVNIPNPVSDVIIGPGCQPKRAYRPPNVPEIERKDSSAYDPIEDNYGSVYTY